MICTATIKIGDGEVTIPINDTKVNSLQDIVSTLFNDKDKFLEVIKLLKFRGVSKSPFDLSKYTLDGQVGNASIRKLINELSNPNLQMLKEFDIDSDNILITPMYGKGSIIQFSNGIFKLILSYDDYISKKSQDKWKITQKLYSFLKLNWIQSVLNGSESELKSEIIKTLSDVINKLIENKKEIKSDRIQNVIENLNKKSGIDKLLDFLAYLYGDFEFSNKTKKYTETVSDFIDDNFVIETPKNLINPNKNESSKILSQLIKDDYKIYKSDLRDRSIKDLLIEFNADSQNLYLGIDYVSEDYIKLKVTTFNTVQSEPIKLIGDEYYGRSVKLIESLRDYDIVEFNGTYYISKNQLIHSEEKLEKAIAQRKKLEDARTWIRRQYKERGTNLETGKRYGSYINTSNYTCQLLVSKSQNIKVSNKVNKGDILKILDCPNMVFQHDFNSLRNAWKPKFIRNMQAVFYGDLVTNISNLLEQFNIIDFFENTDQLQKYKEVLNTQDKLEAFLLRTYDLILSEIDLGTLPKGSNLFNIPANKRWGIINNVLQEFENSEYVFYEVTSDSENQNVSIQKLQRTEQNYEIPKYNIKQDLIAIVQHFREHFGITCNIVTNDEIKTGINGISIDPSAKAFILNGQIYINIDQANSGDLIHEYSHLILGIMKAKNMKQYQDLISIVTKLPDYQMRLDLFRNTYKDTRSEIDLQEEIFVTLFGDFIGNKFSKAYYSQNNDIKNALAYIKDHFVDFTAKAFMLGDSINTMFTEHIYDMPIRDALSMFGSMLFEQNSPISDELNQQVVILRKTTNLIKSLLKEGKKEDPKKSYLLENCK